VTTLRSDLLPGRPVALVGLPGAGKSVVARLLAARLGRAAVDLDAAVEAAAGEPVAAIFARSGEAAFRALEAAALGAALDGGAGVIACGGGLVTAPGPRATLRARCLTVWLEVAPDEAARRLGAGAAARPLLASDPRARLAELLAARAPLYAEVADARVATDGLAPEEVAARVAAALGRAA